MVKSWIKRANLGFLALLLSGQTLSPRSQISAQDALQSSGGPETPLALVIQWEGRDLLHHNLAAIAKVRGAFPDIPVIHMVSPAYFLRGTAEAREAQQKIRSVMRSSDRVGLLLGGWRSLVIAAGGIFRQGPTFWGYELKPQDCVWDCGQEVPLHMYPASELERIMGKGLKTLEEQGFGRPKLMAVTGWVASPQILEVGTKLGITHDLSPVPSKDLKPYLKRYPLRHWVEGLWSELKPAQKSYPVETKLGTIVAVPQSLASIDYVQSDTWQKTFGDLLQRQKDESPKDRLETIFQIVMHQETAHMMVPRIVATLEGIERTARMAHVRLTSPDLGSPTTVLVPPKDPSDPSIPTLPADLPQDTPPMAH